MIKDIKRIIKKTNYPILKDVIDIIELKELSMTQIEKTKYIADLQLRKYRNIIIKDKSKYDKKKERQYKNILLKINIDI